MIDIDAMAELLEPTADPAWVLDEDGFDPLRESSHESRFSICNGLIGIRGARTVNRGGFSIIPPRSSVAGLFDVLGTEQPTPGLVPTADWLQLGLQLSGASAEHPGLAMSDYRRTLDMRRSAVFTGCRLSARPALDLKVEGMRLVSMRNRAIALQVIRIETDEGRSEVTLVASAEGLNFGLKQVRLASDFGVWRTRCFGKTLAVAGASSLQIDGREIAATALGPFHSSWTFQTQPGQVVCFERIVAVVRSDTPDGAPDVAARQHVKVARALGRRGIVAAHEAALAERRQASAITVEGDTAAQQALRFAIYHLNGAANPEDDTVSIGARGLTGADYRGHVFWDTEIYLLPFYTLTWPQAARALLMYRFHTLDGARAKASRMGWRGALYAWESADDGAETTPDHAVGPDRQVMDILCGSQEQHISADIAHAVWHYWLASGDEAFLQKAGAEILFETARFWSSRAVLEGDGRRHIRGVIGPDEYHETIDDNAFTNVMARANIGSALTAAALLRERWPAEWDRLAAHLTLSDAELATWQVAADTMADGLDPQTGLFEQFAGFATLERIDLAAYAGRSVPMDVILGRARIAKSQVIKQADVVALLGLRPEEFPGKTGAANYRYYEPRCSHGSSLSRAMHGLVAARLGLTDLALRYFQQTAAIDLGDTQAATDGGLHVAALGGLWQTAVLGFAGLSLRPDGLGLDPQLPAGWRSFGFPIAWHGRRLHIRIDQTASVVDASLETGDPMVLTIGGTAHGLSREKPLQVDLAGLPARAA